MTIKNFTFFSPNGTEFPVGSNNDGKLYMMLTGMDYGTIRRKDWTRPLNTALNVQYTNTSIIAGGRYFELINETVALKANSVNYIHANIDLTRTAQPVTLSAETSNNSNNVDLNNIQEYLGDFKCILGNFGASIGNFSLGVIMKSVDILTLVIICFIVAVYLLADMDKIRKKVKIFLKRKNKKTFKYVERLDHEVSQYFVGLEKFIIIQFFEYTIIFFLIGHPYYLLLGILSAVTTVIPYFGGIFTNIIAAVTAFFVSRKLFILTLIVAFVCPNIDGYIISPRVYGKTNNVPGLLTIFAVFAGGKLAGIFGIIVALPVTIILLATYRFYEDDIAQKLDGIKVKKNEVEND